MEEAGVGAEEWGGGGRRWRQKLCVNKRISSNPNTTTCLLRLVLSQMLSFVFLLYFASPLHTCYDVWHQISGRNHFYISLVYQRYIVSSTKVHRETQWFEMISYMNCWSVGDFRSCDCVCLHVLVVLDGLHPGTHWSVCYMTPQTWGHSPGSVSPTWAFF